MLRQIDPAKTDQQECRGRQGANGKAGCHLPRPRSLDELYRGDPQRTANLSALGVVRSLRVRSFDRPETSCKNPDQRW